MIPSRRLVGLPSRHFGARLPYLLKLLAADRPLSLQAHPNRAQAEAGHAREDAAGLPVRDPKRLYADTWPKPEMLVALAPVEALCGFRHPTESHALFDALGVLDASALVAPLADGTAESLAEVFGRLLRYTDEASALIAQVAKAARTRRDDPVLGRFSQTATELAAAYPSDPGVIAALTMNRVSLREGQGRYG